MKKTLIITLEFPPHIGGIATYVDLLAQGLPSDKVVVLAPHHKDAKEWDEKRPYTIIRKTLLSNLFWPRWVRLCFLTWSICRKEKIEVVMLHHILPVGYAALFVKKIKRIPYIVFSHGTDIVASTKTSWKKKMVRMVAHGSEQIILNSDSLKRRMLLILPELSEKATVLYPCPEEDYYTKAPARDIEELRDRLALHGKKVILSIARIAEGKGFPHLVAVLTEVAKKNPNIVWIIIGDGPKRQEVIAEIHKNNLQNIVRYIGQVRHEDLKLFYSVADIFCLLTHPDHGFEEGLGLVFLEAAAAGLPTIAGRSGGVEEAVAHMETGIVVDTYQHLQGVDAIRTLVENTEFARRLGDEGQRRVRANFNWAHQLERLKPWIE